MQADWLIRVELPPTSMPTIRLNVKPKPKFYCITTSVDGQSVGRKVRGGQPAVVRAN